MRPLCDPQNPAIVLFLHRVSDVDEFSVFEDQKVVLLGELLESGYRLLAEVGQDINMGFNDGNVGAESCKLNKNARFVKRLSY